MSFLSLDVVSHISPMSKKKAIVDASSAILLFKADLHTCLTDVYRVVLPQSVFYEITSKPYAGSEVYNNLAAEGKIQVHGSAEPVEKHTMARLDKGEHDAIQLYYRGLGDFVIIDDGPAARYCTKEGIPFINALLFPVIMRLAEMKSDDFCRRSMEKVIASGRYSREIISFAAACERESIAFAVP